MRQMTRTEDRLQVTSLESRESKGHKRMTLATHTLVAINTRGLLLRKETHNPPSRNIPDTAYFRPLDIRRRHTFPIGRAKMITSMAIFGIELPKRIFRLLTHFEGIVRSQKPRIGWHMNIMAKRLAIPHAITNAPTQLVAMTNPRVGNIER